MRRRLRNYVAVVMTLLLCMGVWFQHGQMVKAEGEQTATVNIMLPVFSDNDTGMVTLTDVVITDFTYDPNGDIPWSGSISLTADQTKNAEGRSIFYWYDSNDKVTTLYTGNTPTIDISRLWGVKIGEGETETSPYVVTIELYADYGASHTVTYKSNYQMGGSISSNQNDVTAEVTYFQDDVQNLEGIPYNHPDLPTFTTEAGEITWTNEGYFFKGWGLTDSGGVNAPETFDYEEKWDTAIELYAQWQKASQLTVNYYQTKAEMEQQNPCYDPVTVLQESLDDTSFTFTTMPGAETEGEFFAGWQYDDAGTTYTLAENEEKTIAIPEDGADIILNLYGIWSPAAILQVTYDMGGEFDPYTVEVEQASISDTTFSFETSNEAVPPSDTAIFEGWSYTNASGKTVIIGAGEMCSDIPITTTAVTMTAVWKEPLAGGSTVSAGTYTLLAGEPYTLGSGSWTVTYEGSGDSCTYTGGSTFYVTSTGDYTFTAK